MGGLNSGPGPGTTLLIAIVLVLTQTASSAPVYEEDEGQESNSQALAESHGCYYNFQHYNEGERILTNEPCLNCTCRNRMLMCYLRVCPFTKGIGQNCTVEKVPSQCCPIITCPEVPVQLLTSTTTEGMKSSGHYETKGTAVGHLDSNGCNIDGIFYPNGAQVPGSPEKPCELCYCIRNKTACIMQECALHVDGCRPIYEEGQCFPVRYQCDDSPYEEEPTTTIRPPPTPGLVITTTSSEPLDCSYNDEVYTDGARIQTEDPCEHCYCLKGKIACAVQECGAPLEKEGQNCTALPPAPGKCCPDSYQCDVTISSQKPQPTTEGGIPFAANAEHSTNGYHLTQTGGIKPADVKPEELDKGTQNEPTESYLEGLHSMKPISSHDDHVIQMANEKHPHLESESHKQEVLSTDAKDPLIDKLHNIIHHVQAQVSDGKITEMPEQMDYQTTTQRQTGHFTDRPDILSHPSQIGSRPFQTAQTTNETSPEDGNDIINKLQGIIQGIYSHVTDTIMSTKTSESTTVKLETDVGSKQTEQAGMHDQQPEDIIKPEDDSDSTQYPEESTRYPEKQKPQGSVKLPQRPKPVDLEDEHYATENPEKDTDNPYTTEYPYQTERPEQNVHTDYNKENGVTTLPTKPQEGQSLFNKHHDQYYPRPQYTGHTPNGTQYPQELTEKPASDIKHRPFDSQDSYQPQLHHSEKPQPEQNPDRVKPNQYTEAVTPGQYPEAQHPEKVKPGEYSETVTLAQYPGGVQPGHYKEDVKPGEYPEGVKPSQQPEYVKPGEYPEGAKPDQHPEVVTPGHYPEDVKPAKYPEGAKPGHYPETVTPGHYSGGVQPGHYPEDVKPGQYPEGDRLSQQPEDVKPGKYPEGVKPSQQPEYVKPGEYPEGTKPDQHPEAVTPGHYPEDVKPAKYPEGAKPGHYPETVTPGHYPGGVQPGHYPEDVKPGQYPDGDKPSQQPEGVKPEDFKPGQHSEEVTPGQYQEGVQPGHYPGDVKPGEYPEGDKPSRQPEGFKPDQHPQAVTTVQYPEDLQPGHYPEGVKPGKYPEKIKPYQDPENVHLEEVTPGQHPEEVTPGQYPEGVTPAEYLDAKPGNYPNVVSTSEKYPGKPEPEKPNFFEDLTHRPNVHTNYSYSEGVKPTVHSPESFKPEIYPEGVLPEKYPAGISSSQLYPNGVTSTEHNLEGLKPSTLYPEEALPGRHPEETSSAEFYPDEVGPTEQYSENFTGNTGKYPDKVKPIHHYLEGSTPTEEYSEGVRPSSHHPENSKPDQHYPEKVKPTEEYFEGTEPTEQYANSGLTEPEKSKPGQLYPEKISPVGEYTGIIKPAGEYPEKHRPGQYPEGVKPTEQYPEKQKYTENVKLTGQFFEKPKPSEEPKPTEEFLSEVRPTGQYFDDIALETQYPDGIKPTEQYLGQKNPEDVRPTEEYSEGANPTAEYPEVIEPEKYPQSQFPDVVKVSEGIKPVTSVSDIKQSNVIKPSNFDQQQETEYSGKATSTPGTHEKYPDEVKPSAQYPDDIKHTGKPGSQDTTYSIDYSKGSEKPNDSTLKESHTIVTEKLTTEYASEAGVTAFPENFDKQPESEKFQHPEVAKPQTKPSSIGHETTKPEFSSEVHPSDTEINLMTDKLTKKPKPESSADYPVEFDGSPASSTVEPENLEVLSSTVEYPDSGKPKPEEEGKRPVTSDSEDSSEYLPNVTKAPESSVHSKPNHTVEHSVTTKPELIEISKHPVIEESDMAAEKPEKYPQSTDLESEKPKEGESVTDKLSKHPEEIYVTLHPEKPQPPSAEDQLMEFTTPGKYQITANKPDDKIKFPEYHPEDQWLNSTKFSGNTKVPYYTTKSPHIPSNIKGADKPPDTHYGIEHSEASKPYETGKPQDVYLEKPKPTVTDQDKNSKKPVIDTNLIETIGTEKYAEKHPEHEISDTEYSKTGTSKPKYPGSVPDKYPQEQNKHPESSYSTERPVHEIGKPPSTKHPNDDKLHGTDYSKVTHKPFDYTEYPEEPITTGLYPGLPGRPQDHVKHHEKVKPTEQYPGRPQESDKSTEEVESHGTEYPEEVTSTPESYTKYSEVSKPFEHYSGRPQYPSEHPEEGSEYPEGVTSASEDSTKYPEGFRPLEPYPGRPQYPTKYSEDGKPYDVKHPEEVTETLESYTKHQEIFRPFDQSAGLPQHSSEHTEGAEPHSTEYYGEVTNTPEDYIKYPEQQKPFGKPQYSTKPPHTEYPEGIPSKPQDHVKHPDSVHKLPHNTEELEYTSKYPEVTHKPEDESKYTEGLITAEYLGVTSLFESHLKQPIGHKPTELYPNLDKSPESKPSGSAYPEKFKPGQDSTEKVKPAEQYPDSLKPTDENSSTEWYPDQMRPTEEYFEIIKPGKMPTTGQYPKGDKPFEVDQEDHKPGLQDSVKGKPGEQYPQGAETTEQYPDQQYSEKISSTEENLESDKSTGVYSEKQKPGQYFEGVKPGQKDKPTGLHPDNGISTEEGITTDQHSESDRPTEQYSEGVTPTEQYPEGARPTEEYQEGTKPAQQYPGKLQDPTKSEEVKYPEEVTDKSSAYTKYPERIRPAGSKPARPQYPIEQGSTEYPEGVTGTLEDYTTKYPEEINPLDQYPGRPQYSDVTKPHGTGFAEKVTHKLEDNTNYSDEFSTTGPYTRKPQVHIKHPDKPSTQYPMKLQTSDRYPESLGSHGTTYFEEVTGTPEGFTNYPNEFKPMEQYPAKPQYSSEHLEDIKPHNAEHSEGVIGTLEDYTKQPEGLKPFEHYPGRPEDPSAFSEKGTKYSEGTTGASEDSTEYPGAQRPFGSSQYFSKHPEESTEYTEEITSLPEDSTKYPEKFKPVELYTGKPQYPTILPNEKPHNTEYSNVVTSKPQDYTHSPESFTGKPNDYDKDPEEYKPASTGRPEESDKHAEIFEFHSTKYPEEVTGTPEGYTKYPEASKPFEHYPGRPQYSSKHPEGVESHSTLYPEEETNKPHDHLESITDKPGDYFKDPDVQKTTVQYLDRPQESDEHLSVEAHNTEYPERVTGTHEVYTKYPEEQRPVELYPGKPSDHIKHPEWQKPTTQYPGKEKVHDTESPEKVIGTLEAFTKYPEELKPVEQYPDMPQHSEDKHHGTEYPEKVTSKPGTTQQAEEYKPKYPEKGKPQDVAYPEEVNAISEDSTKYPGEFKPINQYPEKIQTLKDENIDKNGVTNQTEVHTAYPTESMTELPEHIKRPGVFTAPGLLHGQQEFDEQLGSTIYPDIGATDSSEAEYPDEFKPSKPQAEPSGSEHYEGSKPSSVYDTEHPGVADSLEVQPGLGTDYPHGIETDVKSKPGGKYPESATNRPDDNFPETSAGKYPQKPEFEGTEVTVESFEMSTKYPDISKITDHLGQYPKKPESDSEAESVTETTEYLKPVKTSGSKVEERPEDTVLNVGINEPPMKPKPDTETSAPGLNKYPDKTKPDESIGTETTSSTDEYAIELPEKHQNEHQVKPGGQHFESQDTYLNETANTGMPEIPRKPIGVKDEQQGLQYPETTYQPDGSETGKPNEYLSVTEITKKPFEHVTAKPETAYLPEGSQRPTEKIPTSEHLDENSLPETNYGFTVSYTENNLLSNLHHFDNQDKPTSADLTQEVGTTTQPDKTKPASPVSVDDIPSRPKPIVPDESLYSTQVPNVKPDEHPAEDVKQPEGGSRPEKSTTEYQEATTPDDDLINKLHSIISGIQSQVPTHLENSQTAVSQTDYPFISGNTEHSSTIPSKGPEGILFPKETKHPEDTTSHISNSDETSSTPESLEKVGASADNETVQSIPSKPTEIDILHTVTPQDVSHKHPSSTDKPLHVVYPTYYPGGVVTSKPVTNQYEKITITPQAPEETHTVYDIQTEIMSQSSTTPPHMIIQEIHTEVHSERATTKPETEGYVDQTTKPEVIFGRPTVTRPTGDSVTAKPFITVTPIKSTTDDSEHIMHLYSPKDKHPISTTDKTAFVTVSKPEILGTRFPSRKTTQKPTDGVFLIQEGTTVTPGLSTKNLHRPQMASYVPYKVINGNKVYYPEKETFEKPTLESSPYDGYDHIPYEIINATKFFYPNRTPQPSFTTTTSSTPLGMYVPYKLINNTKVYYTQDTSEKPEKFDGLDYVPFDIINGTKVFYPEKITTTSPLSSAIYVPFKIVNNTKVYYPKDAQDDPENIPDEYDGFDFVPYDIINGNKIFHPDRIPGHVEVPEDLPAMYVPYRVVNGNKIYFPKDAQSQPEFVPETYEGFDLVPYESINGTKVFYPEKASAPLEQQAMFVPYKMMNGTKVYFPKHAQERPMHTIEGYDGFDYLPYDNVNGTKIFRPERVTLRPEYSPTPAFHPMGMFVPYKIINSTKVFFPKDAQYKPRPLKTGYDGVQYLPYDVINGTKVFYPERKTTPAPSTPTALYVPYKLINETKVYYTDKATDNPEDMPEGFEGFDFIPYEIINGNKVFFPAGRPLGMYVPYKKINGTKVYYPKDSTDKQQPIPGYDGVDYIPYDIINGTKVFYPDQATTKPPMYVPYKLINGTKIFNPENAQPQPYLPDGYDGYDSLPYDIINGTQVFRPEKLTQQSISGMFVPYKIINGTKVYYPQEAHKRPHPLSDEYAGLDYVPYEIVNGTKVFHPDRVTIPAMYVPYKLINGTKVFYPKYAQPDLPQLSTEYDGFDYVPYEIINGTQVFYPNRVPSYQGMYVPYKIIDGEKVFYPKHAQHKPVGLSEEYDGFDYLPYDNINGTKVFRPTETVTETLFKQAMYVPYKLINGTKVFYPKFAQYKPYLIPDGFDGFDYIPYETVNGTKVFDPEQLLAAFKSAMYIPFRIINGKKVYYPEHAQNEPYLLPEGYDGFDYIPHEIVNGTKVFDLKQTALLETSFRPALYVPYKIINGMKVYQPKLAQYKATQIPEGYEGFDYLPYDIINDNKVFYQDQSSPRQAMYVPFKLLNGKKVFYPKYAQYVPIETPEGYDGSEYIPYEVINGEKVFHPEQTLSKQAMYVPYKIVNGTKVYYSKYAQYNPYQISSEYDGFDYLPYHIVNGNKIFHPEQIKPAMYVPFKIINGTKVYSPKYAQIKPQLIPGGYDGFDYLPYQIINGTKVFDQAPTKPTYLQGMYVPYKLSNNAKVFYPKDAHNNPNFVPEGYDGVDFVPYEPVNNTKMFYPELISTAQPGKPGSTGMYVPFRVINNKKVFYPKEATPFPPTAWHPYDGVAFVPRKAIPSEIVYVDDDEGLKPHSPFSQVPGEGSCYLNNQTFANNSEIPPVSPCQARCMCMSSVVRCVRVKCPAPPENKLDCSPMYREGACCPTYSCGDADYEYPTTARYPETKLPESSSSGYADVTTLHTLKPLEEGNKTKAPSEEYHLHKPPKPKPGQHESLEPYDNVEGQLTQEEDYDVEDEEPYGPGTCRYAGKVYVSAQQIPRDDPCDFCFCFRSDIICLQQSCPPPIPGCRDEPIQGFCCPRYECHVKMATVLNVTSTTTTTTTTLPPHFFPHAFKGSATRTGCFVQGKAYRVGQAIPSASGPCMDCICGGNGRMKCEPKVCTPEPMIRKMISPSENTTAPTSER